jgi:hypothetical protein
MSLIYNWRIFQDYSHRNLSQNFNPLIMPFPYWQFLLSHVRKTDVLVQVQMREVTHPSEQVDIRTGVIEKKRRLLLPESASQGSSDPVNP